MPFYEYSCARCGERFELMRSLSDRDAPASCPSCGGSEIRRELPRVNASVSGSHGFSDRSLGGCGGGGG